ncbi:MAG: winged helix-turn-helix domain-containing protein [Candidatus Bathyarchaeia archaeon]
MLAQNKRRGNSHRCQLDVIADILKASHTGVKKTHIMYHCNMSFRQVKYYLDLLLKRKLVHEIKDHNPSIFKITNKGMRFLEVYKDLKALME